MSEFWFIKGSKKLFKIKNRTQMTRKNRMTADKTISDYLHNLRHQRSIIMMVL